MEVGKVRTEEQSDELTTIGSNPSFSAFNIKSLVPVVPGFSILFPYEQVKIEEKFNRFIEFKILELGGQVISRKPVIYVIHSNDLSQQLVPYDVHVQQFHHFELHKFHLHF